MVGYDQPHMFEEFSRIYGNHHQPSNSFFHNLFSSPPSFQSILDYDPNLDEDEEKKK